MGAGSFNALSCQHPDSRHIVLGGSPLRTQLCMRTLESAARARVRLLLKQEQPLGRRLGMRCRSAGRAQLLPCCCRLLLRQVQCPLGLCCLLANGGKLTVQLNPLGKQALPLGGQALHVALCPGCVSSLLARGRKLALKLCPLGHEHVKILPKVDERIVALP
eukprot:scaffold13672_cov28-Tisochrysis_lutea.AAC.2